MEMAKAASMARELMDGHGLHGSISIGPGAVLV